MPPDRIALARAAAAAAGLDAILITRPENVRYLSGFEGSAGALALSPSRLLLITDVRYEEQASVQARSWSVEVCSEPPAVAAASLAGGWGRVGFESDAVTHEAWEKMRTAADIGGGAVLVPCVGLVERIRARKEPGEIEILQKAARIAAGALDSALPLIRPGVSERDVADAIERSMKEAGAEGPAFPLIVASGPRAAMPHGRASGRLIQAGEMVVIDIGARFEGYHSDMTRTVSVGGPVEADARVYQVVREAQARAIAAVKPGALACDVDAAARETIAAAGFGGRFGHATGHGVGLEVHEAPRVGQRSEEVLEPGMVLTIEPGIYLPGRSGARLEDMVAVTETGARLLTPGSGDDWILE